jgi:uncharacterized damage-inducible protein DinB
MNPAQLLAEAFTRIHDVVEKTVNGLSAEQLSDRPGGEGNSIAWLVWHLTRIQDDHIADVAHSKQIWTSKGWAERFALPLDDADTGYGHTSDQVAVVRVSSGNLLTGYFDAVYQRTLDYLSNLTGEDLDRVVDTRWDPPVTLGVRLISVISDDLQHAGQAAYASGLLKVG